MKGFTFCTATATIHEVQHITAEYGPMLSLALKRGIAILALPAMLAACSTSPATGRSQFTGLLPAEQEAALGAQEHEKILAEFGGELANRQLVSAVSAVGERLVPHTERSDVDYTFTTLDSPVVNAFALPGGYVYITRGLLALTNSEAEVAAVLGHEIGHITDRHTAERVSQGALAGLLAAGLAVATGYEEVGLIGAAGAGLYLASYSRDQERSADQLGMRYMTKAGYDPEHMAGLLDGLWRQQELASALEGEDASEQSSLFHTHPLTSERVATAKERAPRYAGRYGEGELKQARERWLSTLEGMIYGDSPAQGFVRDNRFIHPELGFAYEVPNDFKLQNGSSAVTAINARKQVILFDMDSKAGRKSVRDYLASDWGKGELGRLRSFNSNGYNAAWADTNGNVQGEQYRVRLVALRSGETGPVWRFTLAVPVKDRNALSGLMSAPRSFDRISGSEASKYKPHRIALVRAGRRDTEKTLSRRMPFGDKSVLYFRALNATEADADLVQGRLYKIIVEE
ncbi:MAG: M48 family metalloprotease [Alphaproteobacteria bacterium]